MAFDTLATFVAASILLSFAPGPDNLFVLTQSALHGWRAGVLVTLGLCTGLLVHTTAVALGVAVIFQASNVAFTALKIAGALYLLYLAWQSFHAASTAVDRQTQPSLGNMALYRRGIIMNLSNPKVAIFFLAFLPQFTDPQADPLTNTVTLQLFVLGGIFILVAFCVFSLIAAMAGILRRWLNNSSKGQQWLNRIAGLVFIGLAAKLATAAR